MYFDNYIKMPTLNILQIGLIFLIIHYSINLPEQNAAKVLNTLFDIAKPVFSANMQVIQPNCLFNCPKV